MDMGVEAFAPAAAMLPRRWLRDVVGLTKPRLSTLVLCTTAGGMWLARQQLTWTRALPVMLATTLLVAAANAMNSYLERDLDARMLRTRSRPLAAQRMQPRVALTFGLALAAVSLPVLALYGNPATA